jgi:regulatory protein YycI of two-component signal transduction system YycFG
MSIFVFVSFLTSCTGQVDDLSPEKSTQTPVPLLSMQEILKAPDFKDRASEAVLNGDTDALLALQKDVLMLAKQARLSPSEIAKLSGEQGLIFIEFQGKLVNYDKEFMQRLTSFQDLSVLFERYPALSSLHRYSKNIEKQRDEAISAIAEDLKSEGVTGDLESIAKAQWLAALQAQNRSL